VRRWSTDRVTLLGDAAHPDPARRPGTNQALEDAAALAFFFRTGDLRRYEQLRRARTRQIQMGSRGNATCFQLPDGPAADQRNANLPKLPETIGWIHGYDIHTELTH
jgi:salicylate hydroxylase